MDQASRNQKKVNREQNVQHLAALEREGSNLDVAHTTCHQFEIEDENGVGTLRSLLLASGFHLARMSKQRAVDPGTIDFQWKVEAELKVIPMLPSLHEMTDYCCDLARMTNAAYRGWYAQPVRSKE